MGKVSKLVQSNKGKMKDKEGSEQYRFPVVAATTRNKATEQNQWHGITGKVTRKARHPVKIRV